MSGPARARLPRTTRNVSLKVGSDIAGSAWGVCLTAPQFDDDAQYLNPPMDVLACIDGDPTDVILLKLGRVYYGHFASLKVVAFADSGAGDEIVDVTVLPDPDSAVWDRSESPRTLTQVGLGQKLQSQWGEQLAGLDSTGTGQLVGVVVTPAGTALASAKPPRQMLDFDGAPPSYPNGQTILATEPSDSADAFEGYVLNPSFVGGTSPTLQAQLQMLADLTFALMGQWCSGPSIGAGAEGSIAVAQRGAGSVETGVNPAALTGAKISLNVVVSGSPTSAIPSAWGLACR